MEKFSTLQGTKIDELHFEKQVIDHPDTKKKNIAFDLLLAIHNQNQQLQ